MHGIAQRLLSNCCPTNRSSPFVSSRSVVEKAASQAACMNERLSPRSTARLPGRLFALLDRRPRRWRNPRTNRGTPRSAPRSGRAASRHDLDYRTHFERRMRYRPAGLPRLISEKLIRKQCLGGWTNVPLAFKQSSMSSSIVFPACTIRSRPSSPRGRLPDGVYLRLLGRRDRDRDPTWVCRKLNWSLKRRVCSSVDIQNHRRRRHRL